MLIENTTTCTQMKTNQVQQSNTEEKQTNNNKNHNHDIMHRTNQTYFNLDSIFLISFMQGDDDDDDDDYDPRLFVPRLNPPSVRQLQIPTRCHAEDSRGGELGSAAAAGGP